MEQYLCSKVAVVEESFLKSTKVTVKDPQMKSTTEPRATCSSTSTDYSPIQRQAYDKNTTSSCNSINIPIRDPQIKLTTDLNVTCSKTDFSPTILHQANHVVSMKAKNIVPLVPYFSEPLDMSLATRSSPSQGIAYFFQHT